MAEIGRNFTTFCDVCGVTAALDYAGLAPQAIGLYQFNVVVPNIPDSDTVPVTFSLGGATGTQTLYTAVHQ